MYRKICDMSNFRHMLCEGAIFKKPLYRFYMIIQFAYNLGFVFNPYSLSITYRVKLYIIIIIHVVHSIYYADNIILSGLIRVAKRVKAYHYYYWSLSRREAFFSTLPESDTNASRGKVSRMSVTRRRMQLQRRDKGANRWKTTTTKKTTSF